MELRARTAASGMAAEDPYHGVAAHNIPASASAPSLASYSKRAAVAKKLEKHRRPLLCLLATGAVVALYSLALWMSDAQSMMLQMLKCTTGILDEHNITYFIDTGTLLGAIRHGGFLSPNDREDVDLAILATDTARLYAIRHLPYERCGFPMIHRSDRQYIPNVVPVRIKNAAFRVFYNYWVIYYYLDIRDYEMIDGKLVDAEFIATSDTATLDPDRVFPLKKCMFVDAMFSCPRDPEYVLRENFGDDWRVPKPGFKTWMLKK